MEMEQLEYGIIRYGTPAYIFDLDILSQEIKRFRHIFGRKIGLCYAMKANPFLTSKMSEMAGKVEVCSYGEFRICKELGIPPEKLLISGVLKKKNQLYEILKCVGSEGAYTIESPQQFRLLTEWCEKEEKEIHVYLRLTSKNQFGMDEETICSLICEQKKCPFMKVEGIHYFSGTQKKSPEIIRKELNYLDGFLEKLEMEYDFTAAELEYGPGLAVSYFPDKKYSMIEDESLEEIRKMIEGMKYQGHVVLEMGRAMAALCGYYLTTIRDLKRNNEKNYCIVDGGGHQLNYDGQIRGMYRPYVQVRPEKSDGDVEDWTICGALCSVNDILCQSLPLRRAEEGDVLIFERTGAYAMTEGMSLFLSHALPRVMLYSKEMGWQLVRDSQPTFKWNMSKEV